MRQSMCISKGFIYVCICSFPFLYGSIKKCNMITVCPHLVSLHKEIPQFLFKALSSNIVICSMSQLEPKYSSQCNKSNILNLNLRSLGQCVIVIISGYNFKSYIYIFFQALFLGHILKDLIFINRTIVQYGSNKITCCEEFHNE